MRAITVSYSVRKLGTFFNLPGLLRDSTEAETVLWEAQEDENRLKPTPAAAESVFEPKGGLIIDSVSTPRSEQGILQHILQVQSGFEWPPQTPARLTLVSRPSRNHQGPQDSTTTLSNMLRKRKRDKELEDEGHVPRAQVTKKIITEVAFRKAHLDCADQPVTLGAYGAKSYAPSNPKERPNVDRLVHEHGFTLVSWDGA